MMTKRLLLLIFFMALAYGVFQFSSFTKSGFVSKYSLFYKSVSAEEEGNTDYYTELAKHAEERLQANVTYDGAYYQIDYPMGDVDPHKGVCTDVVIRSYRKLGLDLQELVHQDMSKNFLLYPKMWGLLKPDSNIDHRRVPNLMVYFKRQGAALPITDNSADYKPGHVVAWDLGGGVTHIGIVSSKVSRVTGNPMIVHNIGAGPKLEDMLFDYRIIGHYRFGASQQPRSFSSN